jgi:hypothetical protein
MRQVVAEKVQALLPAGWHCRSGVGPNDGLPYWLVVGPNGQMRSAMGLHRLDDQQLKNRVKGMVTRLHLGAHAK